MSSWEIFDHGNRKIHTAARILDLDTATSPSSQVTMAKIALYALRCKCFTKEFQIGGQGALLLTAFSVFKIPSVPIAVHTAFRNQRLWRLPS